MIWQSFLISVIKGSLLAECDQEGHDHFGAVSPNTDWHVAISHAVKLGIGQDTYELIEVS